MAYIDSDGLVIFQSGSIEQHNEPRIFVRAEYTAMNGAWLVHAGVSDPAAPTVSLYKEFAFRYTKVEIDAYTGTGTGDTLKILSALEQALVDTLKALNPTITFTIV